MTDKAKRLRKILLNLGLKGMLKPAKTLEENYIVIVDALGDPSKYNLYKKEGYQQLLERGYTYSPDRVHFLVPTNPRNRRQLEQSMMTNRYGAMHMTLK